MLVSKSIVSLFAIVVAGTAAALAWQARTAAPLPTEAGRATTGGAIRALEGQVATQIQQLAGAEAASPRSCKPPARRAPDVSSPRARPPPRSMPADRSTPTRLRGSPLREAAR